MPALSRIEQVWYYFYVKSRRMSDVAVRGQRPSNSTRTHTPSGGAVCVSFVTLGPPTCFSLFRGSLGFVENTQKSRVSTRRGFHNCSGFSQLLVFFFFSPFFFLSPDPSLQQGDLMKQTYEALRRKSIFFCEFTMHKQQRTEALASHAQAPRVRGRDCFIFCACVVFI